VTIHLIRHATLRIRFGDTVVLVDPMLAGVGEYPAVPDSPMPRPNPLVPLPSAVEAILDGVQLVLVTHIHRDHWDAAAIAAVPKTLTLRCQPADADAIAGQGFERCSSIAERESVVGIDVHRTGGRHGTGEVGQRMGAVSGFVLKRSGLPTIYIAGDTIWCDETARAIERHSPDVIVVNAGAAQFNTGGSITMDEGDVAAVISAAPHADIVAVHMEAWNHCVLTRKALHDRLHDRGLGRRVRVPSDGEVLTF
jgi:L-ascorbate metabolism protein UlaG (beta-lactamase superfamily)